MKLITITHSPCEDDKVPFSYDKDGFIGWIDEVFQEGYKKPETPLPSLEDCLDILNGAGYHYRVEN